MTNKEAGEGGSPDRSHAGEDTLLTDCVQGLLRRSESHDWRVEAGDFWCHVQPPSHRSRVQGWKLHISATPLSAPLVLARSAEILIRHRCSFKFAKDLERVSELVSKSCERGSGGKFITVYPEGDEEWLRALAEELHQATEGLPGPGILSDRSYRPGSLVHYRFGVFSGVHRLGNDGSYEAMLVAPDGDLVKDQRNAWFTPPAWSPRDPFTQERATTPPAGTGKPILLQGRYLVHEVIRHSFAGGVYRATDERTGAAVVVKQARPHVAATSTGEDIRDARRHEAAMLELFASSGFTPRLIELFEQQGDLFLVQEAIAGLTLSQWTPNNVELDDGGGWGPAPEVVERLALDLVELLDAVHARGLVFRDFSPNNVMITSGGELRLIDLEMLARPGEQVVRVFTPGYGAPEQVSAPGVGPAPKSTADLYSLGAVLFHLATGCHPLLPPDRPAVRSQRQRIEEWLTHLSGGNQAAARLAPLIVRLLDDDPARRPDLNEVRGFLAKPTTGKAWAPQRPKSLREADLDRMITDAAEHLIAVMEPDNPRRLWKTDDLTAHSDPFNVQHGAAGVLGALTRAYEMRSDPALGTAATTTARWIASMVRREPRALPGLHFGRSGTAWALLDAGLALGEESMVHLAADLARQVPLRWPNPDVCHGMAGAGLTQLRFWEATGEDDFLHRARQAADAIISVAERRDGRILWPIPRDFASNLAGAVHYGFAHGVAGVGAFLLAAARATGQSTCLDVAVEAAETLLAVAITDQGAGYWPSGEGSDDRLTLWCSGSSGVGTFLVRMWQQTGDDRLLEAVTQAAVAIRRFRWHAGTSQCCGLAGGGEFLLDLAEVSGEEQYRDWAGELAVSIYARHALRDGRIVAPDQMIHSATASFSSGLAGILAFLLRLQHGGQRLWSPSSFVMADTTGRTVLNTSGLLPAT
ncbi:class IV lanthionine synthetase LanL [Microbispora sp. KK1-11]|uniref:class IV lanthionine synthetase LanL n=1 Tax=Microbispora sp. KK1-11 TaxID=2053005 RepID=UPI00163C8027|nr:class IV lanthionine synthetase LanL [Microbispora sp. KK1-11]